MRILVTGGAGFIGRHLVKFLLEKENSVTILDNFSNSNKESIYSLVSLGVKIIEGDIMNFKQISNAINGHDVVIHLAAKISVNESIKNPSETFNVNVEGTKNVLLACKNNNVRKFVGASSAAVYGEGLPNIKSSEDSKINPISPYGESKAMMEQEIKKAMKNNNLDCTILRFFNIFGIGQSDEYAGVITKFIKKISMNKQIEIFGDGMQTRDFVSIYDVINAIYNATQNHRNSIYNVASGKITSINELANIMIRMSGKNIDIKYVNSAEGDIKFSQADITLAKNELDYTPKFGLDDIKKLF